MQWNSDTSHSSIDFKVRHLGVSNVRGTFEDFDFDVVSDDNGTLTGLSATIRVASVTTNDAQRDGHLRSPDFFDAENHPEMTFRSSAVEAHGDGRYRVVGDLTIRGTAAPASFEVEVSDLIADPWGNRRAAASASGTINRTDWGLTWNQVLEAGRLLVGEEITFTIDAQAMVIGEAELEAA